MKTKATIACLATAALAAIAPSPSAAFSGKEFASSPLYDGGEVRFNGNVEDRVNLWPLAYWRDPYGSLAWPFVSWGDDHFAIRPLFSKYGNEYNLLWPIGHFEPKRDDYRFFPMFWGKNHDKSDYFCLFPLLWHNKEFDGVFPFFWGSGANAEHFSLYMFPNFAGEWDKRSTFHTLFPLWWYESEDASAGVEASTEFWAACGLAGYNKRGNGAANSWLFPLYGKFGRHFYSLPYSYLGGPEGRSAHRFLCGLGGIDFTGGIGAYGSSWLFPLYAHDKPAGEFITPLFGWTRDTSWMLPLYYKDKEKLLTPLCGRSGDADWVLPLYWRDGKTFVSLPYVRKLGSDGEIDSAFSLPLLSGCKRDKSRDETLLYLLMGLGGHVWDADGGASWLFPLFYSSPDSFYTLFFGLNPERSWLFPFYYADSKRLYVTPLYSRNFEDGSERLLPFYWRCKDCFATPLFGKAGETDWILPLYVRTKTDFSTLAFSYWNDREKDKKGFFSLPLLTGAEWHGASQEKYWFTLGGLAGAKTRADGSSAGRWLFPLFHSDPGKSFTSLPYTTTGGGTSQTNRYFACGIAGTKSGREDGGWLFPLFHHSKKHDFDEKSSWVGADTLPGEIDIAVATVTNKVWNPETKKRDLEKISTVTNAPSLQTADKWTFLALSDNDSRIEGHFHDWKGRYHIEKSTKAGNVLVFNRNTSRKCEYDVATRKKTSDVEQTDSTLLLGLLWDAESKKNLATGENESSSRVLWKLWDRKEKNGDVSLDVFPGFTYDSKKNGYTKTSFLWRLFRYENNPAKKTKALDILFIPLMR